MAASTTTDAIEPRQETREAPRIRSWIPLLILGAAALPYLGSLRFGFVYDDNVQVLGIPALRSWSFVPGYFVRPIPQVIVRYYRPLFFLWFRLNYYLWNSQAWGWHLTNVALHAVASVLVLFLLAKYFKDARWAAVGALLFAAHPAHIETVAWVSGCTDSLMSIGLLASLLLWMRNRESPSLGRRTASLLCCLLALFTKETAVILPLIVWLHALTGIAEPGQPQGAMGKRLRVAFWEAIPYVGVTGAYLGIRSWVLRGMPGTPDWISTKQCLLSAPSLLLFYIRHLFLPLNLSIFYDLPIVNSVGSRQVWLPLVFLAALAAGTWLWIRRSGDGRIILACTWILLPILPVLYIRKFQPDEFVHDRYLYLPVLGLSMVAAILCEAVFQSQSVSKPTSLPVSAIAVGYLTFAFATVAQAEPWKSNLSLYTHAIAVAPKNTMARNNLAAEYAAEGH